MLRKKDAKDNDERVLQDLYEQCVAQMMSDPNLTEAEKIAILWELDELPDELWEPIELLEGAEPISETIIKTRRGN